MTAKAPQPMAARKSAGFLLAELHRAQHQGARTLDVSTVELSELLARLEQLEAMELRSAAAPVGWAPADKLEAMRRGARKYLTVALYKSDKFDTQVACLLGESQ